MCFKRKRKYKWQWRDLPAGGFVSAGGIEPNRERPRSGEMVLSKQQADAMNINRIFDAYRFANPAPRVCKQCGAPLTGDKCEYCGTYYK